MLTVEAGTFNTVMSIQAGRRPDRVTVRPVLQACLGCPLQYVKKMRITTVLTYKLL